GRHPKSASEIKDVYKISPEKWAIYPALYEYMQYVAYRQLKEAVRYVHSEGGKVMFDIPFFRGKNSVDVINHTEYFDEDLKSPSIWKQTWGDLVLYNWDNLKSVGYEPLILPVQHWLKFGFDGLRLNGIHFAYPLKHLGANITQSGNEKGDDFVSRLASQIRIINPQAIVVAEAFEGTDAHIRNTYGFYTVANVEWYNPQTLKNVAKTGKIWLQITSHNTPRIQDNKEIVSKYKIEPKEESFNDLFNAAINSGAEFVSFTIGDQWGDNRPIKMDTTDGRTLWRYRMPFNVDPAKQFDITELLGKIVLNSRTKTEMGYFQQGHIVGRRLKNVEADLFARNIIKNLQKIEDFILKYNEGKDTLYTINAPGLHSVLVAYQYMKFVGEKGKWSLMHHSYNNDFFNKVYSILNNSGLTEETFPEVWSYIKKLNRQAQAVTDAETKANINIQLFGFIQGMLENILYQQYLSRGGMSLRAEGEAI
ncbi:MAG: 4-alpha-glucanotransferase, partial [Elusimicrobiota bacterium]|nr:4-alpha-glucanotransferase [Elusimicrobiota bacterium]